MKIGIDIGGSHIGVGHVDDQGYIKNKEEIFIKDKTNTENTIEEFIYRKIREMIEICPVDGIGIAVPGTVTDNKIIKAVNLGIENYDLASKLESEFNIPVKIKNDAKCSALAEQKFGALKGYDDAVFLCIGTGIGGAVIYDGKLLEAKKVPGFEFSHMIIKRDGNLCSCGKRGCFETYASMKRFKERISEEYNLNTFSGEKIRKFINENPNDSRLNYMINSYIEDLSIGISNLINIFEPEIICIGGSFAEYEEILYEPLKRKLLEGNLLFNKRDDIIIKHAQLKNDAGIIGATLI